MAGRKSNNNFVADEPREGWAFFEQTNTWRGTPSPSGAAPGYFPKEWGEWVAVSRPKGWLPDENTRLNLGSSLHAAPAATGGEAGGGGMKIGAGNKPQPYGWHGWYGTSNEERRLKEKRRYDPQHLVARARRELGSDRWKPGVGIRGNEYHCNRFVAEMFEKDGGKVPRIGGSIAEKYGEEQSVKIHEATGGLLGGQYPSAEQWTKPMPGFQIVTDPQPGDIASSGGHMGIVTGPGMTISASSQTNTVIENDWGFRPDQKGRIIFQRPINP